MTTDNQDELLVVVDAQDRVVGKASRRVIHRDKLLHRAVHVLVFNGTGLLLLQQRSATKDTYPLHWECVGGHVAPGEEYEQTARREVLEELGVESGPLQFLTKHGPSEATGHEFIAVYKTVISDPVRPKAEEVLCVEPVEMTAVRAMAATLVRPFSPAFIETLRAIEPLGV
jgi:isopentenyl-diphosphate delta-isomerase type 1